MVRRHNRLLVAFHVGTDAVLGMLAFVIAYLLRFETGYIAITRGHPPVEQYLNVLPFVAIIVPLAFHLQGLYRLRRGRSRIDDFFNVLVGSIFAVVLGVVATLYFQAYYASNEQRDVGAFEVSRLVWGLFLVLNISFGYLSRKFIREALERRWLAGIGLRRILIAGAGDLGRVVADRILEHRELGYQIVGFVDDKAGGDHLGYRGLPLLGSLTEAADIVANEKIDDLYVALPLEEHMKLLDLVESTSREGVDVKVVPDLLQFIALRARLEDLDGVPVINLNDVPLQGLSAFVKRSLDIVISSFALLIMALPGLLIAWRIKRSSPGPVFYAQERMGLDGKQFTVYKFRTMRMHQDHRVTQATRNDPRVTRVGAFLRRTSLDELPQFFNVLRGEMSVVGPRPHAMEHNELYKELIDRYMLRHRVKPGITGWAQINGLRGQTDTIDKMRKRIEFDIYYIQHWSFQLDLRIILRTALHGWTGATAY